MEKTSQSDKNIIFPSAIIATSIILFSYGFVWAIYIIIGLMVISSFNIVIASAATINGIVNPQDNIKKMKENGWVRPSKLVLFMSQMVNALGIYSLYTFGLVFLSGIFAATLSIGIVGNFLITLKGDE